MTSIKINKVANKSKLYTFDVKINKTNLNKLKMRMIPPTTLILVKQIL